MDKNKKALAGFLLISLLSFSVVPYLSVSAQTCDPDALVPVSYGQRGTAVRNAQACLMEAGYDIPAGATGYYGSQTREAVKKFYADWYGPWHGNNLGPMGVAELKSMLTQAPEQPQQPTGGQQPSGGVSQQVLMQVLTLLTQGKTNEALALLLQALGGQAPTTTPTTTQQAQEGFLTVEQDPSVTGVTLREGETGKVFGLRFRADNGPVNVQSVFLRWNSNTAPYRVISNLRVLDDQGNALYQTAVTSRTFYQDSSLNYYLPVSGLNYNVPVNQYRSLFVEVTVVGTLPSGVSSAGFKVNANDVRARDGLGIDRFGPTSPISQSFSLQQSLAGSAYLVVARNANTPQEGLVFANPTDGRVWKVKVLSFDVTAKNDNLRLTEVTATTSGSANVTALYLAQGNQILDVKPGTSTVTFNVVPANFVVNKDQTVTFDILADVSNAATLPATLTVRVATVTAQNSLGGQANSSGNAVSNQLSFVTVGPEVQLVSMNTEYIAPSQNVSSSYKVTLTFNVTPRGGTVYMGTSSSPTTTFVALVLQKDTGATSTPNGGVTVQLKQGNQDITNTLNPAAGNGLYPLSEGQTYTFVVTAVQNGAPSGNTGLYRWIVDRLIYRVADPGSDLTVPGVSKTWMTGYTNVQ